MVGIRTIKPDCWLAFGNAATRLNTPDRDLRLMSLAKGNSELLSFPAKPPKKGLPHHPRRDYPTTQEGTTPMEKLYPTKTLTRYRRFILTGLLLALTTLQLEALHPSA